MKVVFDTKLQIAGIGLVPWTRLGPEQWFPNYMIASLYGWDLGDVPGAPKVVALADHVRPLPKFAKLNSQHLLDNDAFQRLIISNFPRTAFLTYKPVSAPAVLHGAGCTFLAVKQATEQLENKANIRAMLQKESIPFPHYSVYDRQTIATEAGALKRLLAGREAVIVQDEQMGGGRGTFLVRTERDLQYALAVIERLGGGKRLVVSDFIENAFERSVQCCATRYGVFVGPLQKQIIGQPLLANLDVPDGDRFCGAEISPHDPLLGAYDEIRTYAQTIGKRIQQLGYRGIFSVDCLISQSGRVYVLEVNPRLTGITPLLTKLHRPEQDIPFYLLHILELANIDYTLPDRNFSTNGPEGSLLILHSQSPDYVNIVTSPSSGLYDMHTRQFMQKHYQLNDNDGSQLLVQQYTPPGFTLKPGGRLLTVFSRNRVLDDDDNLTQQTADAVAWLSSQITTQKADV